MHGCLLGAGSARSRNRTPYIRGAIYLELADKVQKQALAFVGQIGFFV